jgi:hypothetical protein
MTMPASVAVNPQSSTEAASGAGGGIGSMSFYMGGNPNLAMLGTSFAQSKVWPLAIAGVAAVALFLFIRR